MDRLRAWLEERKEQCAPTGAAVHAERRRPGVTMELLHLEYLQREPGGYRYSWFCHEYMLWAKRCGATMRQVHRAGEKVFVDYAGKRPCIWDSTTGEKVDVERFVAVLGASNFTLLRRRGRSEDLTGSPVTSAPSRIDRGIADCDIEG
jgi:transposase